MSAEIGSYSRQERSLIQKLSIGRFIMSIIHARQAKKITMELIGHIPNKGQELTLSHNLENGSKNPNCGPIECPDQVGFYYSEPYLTANGRSFVVDIQNDSGAVKQFSILIKSPDGIWVPTGWHIIDSSSEL